MREALQPAIPVWGLERCLRHPGVQVPPVPGAARGVATRNGVAPQRAQGRPWQVLRFLQSSVQPRQGRASEGGMGCARDNDISPLGFCGLSFGVAPSELG